jgi:putative transposase
MPVKRPQFANGEIYHVILRGIAGQRTFLETRDFLRYILSLCKFNDKEPVFSITRDFSILWSSVRDVIPNTPFPQGILSVDWQSARDVIPNIEWEIIPKRLLVGEKPREPLIEILAFCLMPNHIHLLIRQLVEGGISLFFQKMGGYPSYFNKKYERFGSLFQRPFKAIHIKEQDQLLIVVTYIHLNPIDLIEPNWKTEGIFAPQKVMEFLESYPWSSYPHYLKKWDLSWLISSDFLGKIFEGPEGFQEFVRVRVFYKAELENFLEKAQQFSLE